MVVRQREDSKKNQRALSLREECGAKEEGNDAGGMVTSSHHHSFIVSLGDKIPIE